MIKINEYRYNETALALLTKISRHSSRNASGCSCHVDSSRSNSSVVIGMVVALNDVDTENGKKWLSDSASST